jgi:O-antigen/teichoic acid export membrane protein
MLSEVLELKPQRVESFTWEGDGPFARILSGVSWTIAGTVISQAIALGVTILLSRSLGKTVFGQFGIILTTVQTMAGVAGCGFGLTATRHISLFRVGDPARAGRTIGMLFLSTWSTGLLFAAALSVGSPYLAQHTFRAPGLSALSSFSSVYLLFATLNGFQLGVLVGLEVFKWLAAVGVLQAVLSAALILSCAWKWGLGGAILGLNASGLCTFLIYSLVLARACRQCGIPIIYKDVWKERSVLAGFGLPAALSGIVGNIAISACAGIAVHGHDGFKEFATISAANNVRLVILFAPGIVSKVALPIHCGEHGKGNRLQLLMLRQFSSTALLAVVAALGIIAFGPSVLRLFGKEFVDDGAVLAVFCGVAACEVIAGALAQLLIIFNKLWFQVAIVGIWSVALIAVSTFLIQFNRPSIAVGVGYLVAWLTSLVCYGTLAYALLRSRSTGSGLCLSSPS